MSNEIDPGFKPGVVRRVIIISCVFILFGVAIIPMSITAWNSGESIPMLSRGRAIYGWEGFAIAFLSVVVGIGGIWAAIRHKRQR